MEAIRTACHFIQGGAGNCYIAGGVESTSTSPFQNRARFSPETIGDPDMGVAAEYVAERYNITREMQDEYACLSYKRTLQALEKGYIHDEILSFNGLLDESIKPEMNYERMIKRTKRISTKWYSNGREFMWCKRRGVCSSCNGRAASSKIRIQAYSSFCL